MLARRLFPVYLLTGLTLIAFFYLIRSQDVISVPIFLGSNQFHRPPVKDGQFPWSTRPEKHPVSSLIPLPTGYPVKIPSIQHKFAPESAQALLKRNKCREKVEETFTRAWNGYREHAWMKDELAPISGSSRNHFGGWAATLVDSLDTLWIMDMKEEFEQAVESVKNIDFTTTEEEEINTFETTIRYLGGLLAAFDLSDGKYPILLNKAVELGDMLYAAFDTPNRMPITRWHWKIAISGTPQKPDDGILVAEIGSLSLEFTRLSQLTGDAKFFDAVQRISNRFEQAQSKTKLPGMWPVLVYPQQADFGGDGSFTLGAMADSVYEYLPKQYMLLGGLSQQYRNMYEKAIDAAKRILFYRPMTPNEDDILISAGVAINSDSDFRLNPQGQHLVCFVGGMMGIGSRIFNRSDDLPIARKLIEGCTWAYRQMPSGIMPETFHVVPCEDTMSCKWDEKKWLAGVESRHDDLEVGASGITPEQIKELGLFPGFTDIPDRRYILRPETIESLFVLYRITGDEALRDTAWEIFQSINQHTTTDFGSAALSDVTHLPPPQSDSMESFWTAETLKYFYLIFSEPSLIDLDHFVFNTEAHPFRRPQ